MDNKGIIIYLKNEQIELRHKNLLTEKDPVKKDGKISQRRPY